MNLSRRPRNAHGFRPLAILLTAAVSGVISAPSATLAALPVVRCRPSRSMTSRSQRATPAPWRDVHRDPEREGQVICAIFDRAGYGLESGRLPVEDRDLKFAGGHRTNKVAITIKGDTLDEANETFFVRLTNVVGATITDGEGMGTITDNDAPPTYRRSPP